MCKNSLMSGLVLGSWLLTSAVAEPLDPPEDMSTLFDAAVFEQNRDQGLALGHGIQALFEGFNPVETMNPNGSDFTLQMPTACVELVDDCRSPESLFAGTEGALTTQIEATGYGQPDNNTATTQGLMAGFDDSPTYLDAFGAAANQIYGEGLGTVSSSQDDAIWVMKQDGTFIDEQGNAQDVSVSPSYLGRTTSAFVAQSRALLTSENLNTFAGAFLGGDATDCALLYDLTSGTATRRIERSEICTKTHDNSGTYQMYHHLNAALVRSREYSSNLNDPSGLITANRPGSTILTVNDNGLWAAGQVNQCISSVSSARFELLAPQAILDMVLRSVTYDDSIRVLLEIKGVPHPLYEQNMSATPSDSDVVPTPMPTSCTSPGTQLDSASGTVADLGCDAQLNYRYDYRYTCTKEWGSCAPGYVVGAFGEGCEQILYSTRTTSCSSSPQNIGGCTSGTCTLSDGSRGYNASCPVTTYENWARPSHLAASEPEGPMNLVFVHPDWSTAAHQNVPVNLNLLAYLDEIQRADNQFTLVIETRHGLKGGAKASIELSYDPALTLSEDYWSEDRAANAILNVASGIAEFVGGEAGFSCDAVPPPYAANSEYLTAFAPAGVLLPLDLIHDYGWIWAVSQEPSQSETVNQIKSCRQVFVDVDDTFYRASNTLAAPVRDAAGLIVLDAWGQPVMETIVLDNEEGRANIEGTCQTLLAQGCVPTGRESCVEGGTNPSTGECLVVNEIYDCGYEIPIAEPGGTGTIACSGTTLPCIGDACVPREENHQFTKVAGLLQVAENIRNNAQCSDADPEACELWQGTAKSCKKILTGSATSDNYIGQNCCYFEDSNGQGRFTEFFKTMLKVQKLSDGQEDLINVTAASDFTNLQQSERSVHELRFEDIDGVLVDNIDVVTARADFGEAQDAAQVEKNNHLGQRIDQLLSNLLGADYGDTLVSIGVSSGWHLTQDQIKDLSRERLAELVGEQISNNVLAISSGALSAITTAELLIEIIYACEAEEVSLYADKQAGFCSFVGSYCQSDTLFGCFATQDVYCCYADPLARIIAEGIRRNGAAPELGTSYQSFGGARAPACEGVKLSDLDAIDWSRVDVEEWIDLLVQMDVVPNMAYDPSDPSAFAVNFDRLTGGGSYLSLGDTTTYRSVANQAIPDDFVEPEQSVACRIEYEANPLIVATSASCRAFALNQCKGTLAVINPLCQAFASLLETCELAARTFDLQTLAGTPVGSNGPGCYEWRNEYCLHHPGSQTAYCSALGSFDAMTDFQGCVNEAAGGPTYVSATTGQACPALMPSLCTDTYLSGLPECAPYL